MGLSLPITMTVYNTLVIRTFGSNTKAIKQYSLVIKFNIWAHDCLSMCCLCFFCFGFSFSGFFNRNHCKALKGTDCYLCSTKFWSIVHQYPSQLMDLPDRKTGSLIFMYINDYHHNWISYHIGTWVMKPPQRVGVAGPRWSGSTLFASLHHCSFSSRILIEI